MAGSSTQSSRTEARRDPGLGCAAALTDSDDDAAAKRGSPAAVGTTSVVGKEWGRGHVVVAVGPERGWSDNEIALLASRGYVATHMGSRTLSSPTAVVSSIAIVQEALR